MQDCFSVEADLVTIATDVRHLSDDLTHPEAGIVRRLIGYVKYVLSYLEVCETRLSFIREGLEVQDARESELYAKFGEIGDSGNIFENAPQTERPSVSRLHSQLVPTEHSTTSTKAADDKKASLDFLSSKFKEKMRDLGHKLVPQMRDFHENRFQELIIDGSEIVMEKNNDETVPLEQSLDNAETVLFVKKQSKNTIVKDFRSGQNRRCKTNLVIHKKMSEVESLLFQIDNILNKDQKIGDRSRLSKLCFIQTQKSIDILNLIGSKVKNRNVE